MSEIEVREFQPDDIETFHALHDAVFPPVPFEQMRRWMARDDVTAGVAVQDGRIVGEIPLHVREFVIRPGLTARLAFEHSVCVQEEMRGQGIGSAIQDEIKRFMQGRADVLSVYRGGERTAAYNHYDRNGLKDLCYVRSWTLARPAAVAAGGPEPQPADAILAREAEIIELFESAYAHAGGYQRRALGFYETAMTQLEAVELGTEYRVLFAGEGGRPEGHCIIGLQEGGAAVTVMELATRDRDPAVALRLLRGVCGAAVLEGMGVTVELHDGGAYRPVFEALGFAPQPRGNMIMATPLDRGRVARATWLPQPGLADARVEVWMPREEFVAHEPNHGPSRTITLEMKHEQAARWLLSRLDLGAALEREMVTCRGARPGDREALARAIPWTPWEVQGIDHI